MRQETVGHQVDLPSIPRIARSVEWRPWNGSTSLIGHCSIAFQGGWVINRIPIFRKAVGSLNAGTPNAAALIGADGKVKVKQDGTRSYKAIVTSQNAAAKERWTNAILTGLADAGVTGEAQQ